MSQPAPFNLDSPYGLINVWVTPSDLRVTLDYDRVPGYRFALHVGGGRRVEIFRLTNTGRPMRRSTASLFNQHLIDNILRCVTTAFLTPAGEA